MATEVQARTLDADQNEALINAQLQRTRSQVKGVEFGQRMLKLIVGVLAFFLVATLLDHWVVSEGLPIWARVVLWLTLIGGVLWYAMRALLPLLLYRVNPLYAARTIEETKPSLKNSLINYLTLRSEQDRLPTVIYDAIAKQAATGVKDASVDHAVDHAPLIRWGYLLLGLTFCFALYFVISPKNPFRTVARVVVPWADLTAPSRVQIVEVTPGSAQLYRGKTVKVEARIEGLDEDEPATLYYTTADGQQREQPILLKLNDVRNYTALLPAPVKKDPGLVAAPRELAGLQQDFEYYIAAGDARSKTFRVQVAPAPYIGVERIEYKYPAYTKKPAETRQGEVNIEAIEGTTVTIHGTANQPLKRAWIELRDNMGKPTKFPEMKITGQSASGSWMLGLKDGAREQPEFPEYALRFRNQQGDDNPEPIVYPVKVIRDEAPTIDILAPSSAEITVPWDQPITFEVRAQDPDFALIEVQLLGMRGEKIAFTQNIASFAVANAQAGTLQKKLSISPQRLGLQVGDVIDYWATATDNKFPNPNIAQTKPRVLRVIEAQKNNRNPNNDPLANKPPQNNPNPNPPQDQNQKRDPNAPPPADGQQQDNNANQPPMGNQGQGEPRNDSNMGQGQDPKDPTNLNNQDPNNPPPNGDPRSPNQDTNQKDQAQNKANESKPNNDSGQGNKSGEQPQNPAGKQSNEGKNNAEQNPMSGGNQNQSQKDNQGGNQQTGTKSGEDSKQNSPSGGQSNKSEQNGNPEQNQKAGRPQEQNNKVNPDGSQDGDAMQRLKEHFEKNQKTSQEQASNPSQPTQSNEAKQEPGKQDAGKQNAGKKEAGKEPNGQQSGKQESANKSADKPENGKQENAKQGGNQQGQASPSKELSTQQNGNNKSGDAGKQESNKQENGKQQNGNQPAANETKQPNAPEGKQEPNAGQKSDQVKQEQPGPGNQSGEQTPGKAGAGDKPEAGPKAEQGSKSDPSGKEPGDMGQDGNRKSPEKNQSGANAKDSNPQGSKSGNTTEPESKQNPTNNKQQDGMGNPNGSPMAQDKGKPNANPSDSNSNKQDDQNKEQSPSNRGNDSASKGEDGGDRNGGGSKGGGQQENKPGRGASGSNTEDDKGANAGKQQGDGETGTKAGNQQKSDGQTGKSGNEKGNGTEQKQGNGKQSGGEANKNKAEGQANKSGKQPGEPGGQPGAQTGPPNEQQAKKDGPAGNMPGGGGNSSAPAVPPEYNGSWQDTPEDKVNEAYAKKATDLVLEQMKNQLRSGNVDQDLLNKLGWTKDDAQRFVDRWETLKREAQQAGPSGDAAAAKLQERLRSLGLRPQQSSNTGDNVADDTQRGNRVNRRSAPPSEYRDIYRAFQKGASGG